MQEFIDQLPKLAKDTYLENKKFFVKLKKNTPKRLDYLMQDLHEEEFEKTDCMECANCCKTTSPIFSEREVERISKFLKMKASKFEEVYLKRDDDNDLVLKESPCAFLGADNFCGIYDVRPKACSEYPHTNRKKFERISDLTLKNVAICPAAYNIVEKLKSKLEL